MKALTRFLDFAVNQDWGKPGPTALAAGALVASIGALFAGLSDGWKVLFIFTGSMALCFLVVPRVMAILNAEKEMRAAEDAKWEARNEAFRALGPEIAWLIQMAESALDSDLLKEDCEERHEAYRLLLRLQGEFAIDVPGEPILLMTKGMDRYLHEIARMAYAKDLKAAQKLELPSPW